jgi:hypothetical protein
MGPKERSEHNLCLTSYDVAAFVGKTLATYYFKFHLLIIIYHLQFQFSLERDDVYHSRGQEEPVHFQRM